MDITFGIITSGNDEFLHKIIDSIEAEQIPNYEVIVVGAFSGSRKNTTVIPFDENRRPMWITMKKMMIAKAAKYPVLVMLHDYICLKPGFYEGFVRFGSDWDVAMCRMLEQNGNRSMDWMGLPNDPIYGNVLHPYDYSDPRGKYVPGNFFVVKREFLLQNPLDLNRIWCQGEDIEWSKRIFGGADNSEWLRNILRIPMDIVVEEPTKPAVYKMNVDSAVEFLKDKPTNPCYYEPYDLHSGDNSRPKGFKREDYRYMMKRSQNKGVYILTLGIGADYCKALVKAFESKKLYAEKHGYTYIQGSETFWDRERPISWSKVPFLLHHLKTIPEGSIVWLSDADVYITNPQLKIEDHILPLLPGTKDLLMTFDSCGHVNAGNIIMRNTAWTRDFWRRVYDQTDCIYHIWWENAGILKLLGEVPEDREHVEITRDHKRFNAYIQGLPNEPLWEPGDFLVHFAGIYDPKRMAEFIEAIRDGKVPRIAMV